MKRPLSVIAVLGLGLFIVSGGPVPARAGAEDTPVTFSNQVVRILQRQCQTCHHPGGVAPFALMDYQSAVTHAEQIRDQTGPRYMPPWKPRTGCGGPFVSERRLTDAEIATIARWVADRVPEGNPSDMPAPLVFPDEWQLGDPDVAFRNAPDGYEVPANREHDIFRCFSITPDFPVDRYVTAFEIHPGKGVYVHHALIYLDVDGQSAALDARDPGPGYDNLSGPGFDAPLIAGWNPGARPVTLPDGIGIRIPAHARLVMQVHYHSDVKVQLDRTELGFYFARTPVRKSRYTIIPKNEHFLIPAGDPHYEVDASVTIPEDVTVRSIAPHMHKIGKDMRVEGVLPDGSSRCLVGVDWDINWQGTYTYQQPIPLAKGTRVNVRAFYDNSDANPNNPNHPPKDVPWFPEEDTEMCFCTLGVTSDAEELPVSDPSVESVRVVGSSLVVRGEGFMKGGFLLVKGRLVPDTHVLQGGRMAVSRNDWRNAAAAGETVRVTVLNPDGASAAEASVTP